MKSARLADTLAREHTQRAIETLAEIMEHGEEAKDRLSAAKELLDRGHGKPLAATIQLPMTKRMAAALFELSDDELLERVQAKPLPRLAQPAIDAQVVDPLLT